MAKRKFTGLRLKGAVKIAESQLSQDEIAEYGFVPAYLKKHGIPLSGNRQIDKSLFVSHVKKSVEAKEAPPPAKPKKERQPRQPRVRRPRKVATNQSKIDWTKDFYASFEWRKLRLQILRRYGRKCLCCGRSPEDGAVMHVDHIKPLRIYPELKLEPANLQVLCEMCNHGKGNWCEDDFRPKPKLISKELA